MSEESKEGKRSQQLEPDQPEGQGQQSKKEPEVDPTAMMIQFYDNWTKSWSKAMSEAVSSQSFAETMSQQMEGSLDTMKLVRRQVGEIMEQYLQQVSLPSRKEVLSLAERLTRIEMEVDDLGARMDEALELLKDIQGSLPKDSERT